MEQILTTDDVPGSYLGLWILNSGLVSLFFQTLKVGDPTCGEI